MYLKLREQTNTLEVKEGLFGRNLTIFPLQGDHFEEEDFITLDEGFSNKVVDVEELSQSQVNSVRLINRGSSMLFVLDGEEIRGALQNRVFNTTVILDPMMEEVVPVSCVEQGRWHGSARFEGSTACSNPTVRATLNLSVTKNVRERKGFRSDQSAVWRSVSTTLKTANVHSETMSLSSAFMNLNNNLDEFVKECEELKKYNGFLVAAGSDIVGMDYFYNQNLYNKMFEKVLKSYALEAMVRAGSQRGNVTRKKVDNFLKKIFESEVSHHKGVGKGKEYRILEGHITGKLTLLKEKPVHLSAFAVN